MQLRKYQSEAVEHLKEATEHLLRSVENEILIFQAPTGSGKTIIMADYLKKIVVERKDERKFSFIWISVRKLHDQSKDKLEKYYENDKLLACSYFEDLQDNRIAENEILFINWQSINKKDINIYVRENELDNNLKSIIQNTNDDGRDIMLIIDESHHTASSEKSKELVDLEASGAVIKYECQWKRNSTPMKGTCVTYLNCCMYGHESAKGKGIVLWIDARMEVVARRPIS